MSYEYRFIKIFNDEISCLITHTDLVIVLTYINNVLSEIDNLTSHSINENINGFNRLISWKSNNDYYIFETTATHLNIDDLLHIGYFFFNKNDIMQMNSEYLNNIACLNPTFLCDLFVQEKILSNPFVVLLNVYNLNQQLIYQTFIHYLNQTVTVSDKITNIDLSLCVYNFTHNNYNKASFEKLLLKYFKMKQIMPFMIDYKKYEPKFIVS